MNWVNILNEIIEQTALVTGMAKVLVIEILILLIIIFLFIIIYNATLGVFSALTKSVKYGFYIIIILSLYLGLSNTLDYAQEEGKRLAEQVKERAENVDKQTK